MALHTKSFSTEAIVLKRNNVGEADRIITLYSQSRGKISTVAKGVRLLKSSRSAILEPGNHIQCLCIVTKSLPILTQARLITDASLIRDSLPHLRQLLQLLEILDALFVDEENDEAIFADVLELRGMILNKRSTTQRIRDAFAELITNLGYQHIKDTPHQSITEYVSVLSDKQLKSWDYLKVG